MIRKSSTMVHFRPQDSMFIFMVLLMFFLIIELVTGCVLGSCPVGQYCSRASACIAGCIISSACPAGHYCDLRSGTPGDCVDEDDVDVEEEIQETQNIEEEEENDLIEDIIDFITENSAPIAAAAGFLALAPPALPMFPPLGAPQPGGVGTDGGAGSLPSVALAVSSQLAAEVTTLVAGIPGAAILSVFSSDIAGSFVAERTLPATAVLFAEEAIETTSRLSSNENLAGHGTCPRPVFNIGHKITNAKNKLSPFLNRISKILDAISRVQLKISTLKLMTLKKLRLTCLFPKLIRPFQPLLRYTKCKLGLNGDGFMETPSCNASACNNPIIEDQMITRDLGIPNLSETFMEDAVTLDDCFDDMTKVEYGSRIHVKLVSDESCEDPKYASMCRTLIEENLVIMENTCKSPGCTLPSDDPFRSCFGCKDSSLKRKYNKQSQHSYIDRQTGEMFQATQQSRRVICGTTASGGGQNCRLRIDKAMQFRRVTYGRAIQFIQSEQYLQRDDVDII